LRRLVCKITRRTNKKAFSMIPYSYFFYLSFFTGRTKATGVQGVITSHKSPQEKERKVREEQKHKLPPP
jgi:hypothetical protein